MKRLNRASSALLASLVLAACGSDDDSLGEAGESCAARRDCADGLACFDQVCVEQGAQPGPQRGGVGESCRASNDCQSGLACFDGLCVTGDVAFSVTGASCYRVECESKDECCGSFQPSPSCDLYEADCAQDPIYCPTYRSLCLCNRGCQDNLCVDLPPPCESHDECASFLSPFCVEGRCSECGEHGDCPSETDRCIDGTCQAPCTLDEQCPLLHACQEGECVEVGCSSDRECYFLRRDARARCAEGACSVPCERDSECISEAGEGSFQICEAGECVFVGCESDAECRAALNLGDSVENVRAVCR